MAQPEKIFHKGCRFSILFYVSTNFSILISRLDLSLSIECVIIMFIETMKFI
jgi:hypothetical protein